MQIVSDRGMDLAAEQMVGLDNLHLVPLTLTLDGKSYVSGVDITHNDFYKLLENTDPESRLAVDVFCYRIRKYLGAYLAVLGGCDAILLGGGIGENSPAIRSRIFANLEWCDIGIDETANQGKHEQPLAIHISHSRCSVWVIPVDEAQLMVREAIDFLQENS